MTTQRAASATSAGSTTRHSLRPVAQRHPAVEASRRARIFHDHRGIVVRSPDGSERCHPVGGRGIRRAVHLNINDPGIAKRLRLSGVADWGVLDFRDSEGRGVLRVPLAAWLPEASVLDVRPVSGSGLLELTGAKELVRAAGIPLDVVTSPDDPLWSASGDEVPTACFVRPLPRWFSTVRAVATAVLVVGLLAGAALRHSAPWLLVLGAAAALALPLVEAAVRVPAAIRERRGLPASAARFSPHPPQDSGASVRFLATAAIRVHEDDVVVVSGLGHERWLPRTGAHAIARIVRVVGRDPGQPLGVELQDADGNVRAALPWRWWFGGPDGEARWGEFTGALARPVVERRAGSNKGEPGWPQAQVARADTALMAPMPAGEARRATGFYRAVVHDNTAVVAAILSLVLLGAGLAMLGRHAVIGAVTGVLSGVAFGGFLVPALVHQVRGRLHLDRPASRREPRG